MLSSEDPQSTFDGIVQEVKAEDVDKKALERFENGDGETAVEHSRQIKVAGGGFVAGSATLLGGDPGIGKSTLLLQAAASLARKNLRTVYISGEEALAQLRMRAARLKLTDAPVELAAETNIADIRKTLEGTGDIGMVIIDSIQTMWSPAIEAAPGTVSQVRVSGQYNAHR